MIIRYSFTGGTQYPPPREILKIDEDGSFWMWRSLATATDPPTPIGRFVGRLDTSDHLELRSMVEDVEAAGNLRLRRAEDSSIERIDVGDVYATLDRSDQLKEPWQMLVRNLRVLLGALTKSPAAAIALQMAESGAQVRFVHLGKQPLKVDFAELEVRKLLFQGQRRIAQSKIATDHLPKGEIVIGEGWNLELPLLHPHSGTTASKVACAALFAAYDGGSRTPALLVTT